MARSQVFVLVSLALAISLTACADQPSHSVDDVRLAQAGKDLYRVSCAACHGADAQGTGPVAPLLNIAVPDLTRIAQRRSGKFPELEIFRIIDGQADLSERGPRHMPVWGYEFFGDEADDERAHQAATDKVDRLVAYLRSIQRAD